MRYVSENYSHDNDVAKLPIQTAVLLLECTCEW